MGFRDNAAVKQNYTSWCLLNGVAPNTSAWTQVYKKFIAVPFTMKHLP